MSLEMKTGKRFTFDSVENFATFQTRAVQFNFDNEIQNCDKKRLDEVDKESVSKKQTVDKKRKNPQPGSKKKALNVKKQTIESKSEQIDLCYDHGYSKFYYTTDAQAPKKSDKSLDEIEERFIQFWTEVFGFLHIGCCFITTFLLQLLRFILSSIVRPLTIGIIQITSDHFIKPLLTVLFNELIQPPMILLYNIAVSLRDLCEPLAQAIGYVLEQIARLFKAIRLIDIRTVHKYPESYRSTNDNV